ncbi:MAG: Abi-alpha family protein [Elainellaceae cyanobacterium]
MSEHKNQSLDILGIKPIADSFNVATKAIVDGSSKFLSRICLPAAEEFGLLLRDRVSHWRAVNAARMVANAESMVKSLPDADKRHAHPRLVAQIIEHGSWTESDEVQRMWAGLLASSCTVDGSDDSNLIFIDTLSRLTLIEARILDYACKESTKGVTHAGWLIAQNFSMSLEQLQSCSRIDDFHRIDRELDHLRTFGLIAGGFDPASTDADVTPSTFALQMYARCNGWAGDLLEFFGLSLPSNNSEQAAV